MRVLTVEDNAVIAWHLPTLGEIGSPRSANDLFASKSFELFLDAGQSAKCGRPRGQGNAIWPAGFHQDSGLPLK
jgi:hypothetical protein